MATKQRTEIQRPQPSKAVAPSDQGTIEVQENPAELVQQIQQREVRFTPAQVMQLQRTLGNRAVQRLLQRATHQTSAVDTIQRQFQPVSTTKNAHLRDDGQWGTKIGNKIQQDSEIVVDPAQEKTQTRRVIKNVTWTKAVNVTGETWDWAANGNPTTYVRKSSIGQAKAYPQPADMTGKLPYRAKIDNPQLNWHHLTGEFVEMEDSVSTDGAKIAWHKGAYKRITPATGQINALDADEQRQINMNDLEAYLTGRVEAVIRAGIGPLPWVNALVTAENIKNVIGYSKVSPSGQVLQEGSKAIRFADLGKSVKGPEFVSYYRWVTAADGPLQRISEGSVYVRNSLEHWRKSLNPPDGDNVTITTIEVNGSDLHEHGLGVLFVTFNKPANAHADYPAGGDVTLVVKPEERILEQKLFGTQVDSLANEINATVGLAGPDQITTYKQSLAHGMGTLCEKVVGDRAKDLPKDQVRPITQALKESLIFVLITGLTDLHGENILWHNGKPYMIDADNALKLKYMTPTQATVQNGYKLYNNALTDPVLAQVYNGAVGYETDILRALQNPNTLAKQRLLEKVKAVFSASVGRTVPIETGSWAKRLQVFIKTLNVGLPTDVPVMGKAQTTKWQWCNYWANTVPTGQESSAPGLQGEVGVRHGTNGNFQTAVEAAQLFADMKVGQIPFYNYRYLDGKVLHNGQVIWDGQPIAERMAGLFALFPNQLNP